MVDSSWSLGAERRTGEHFQDFLDVLQLPWQLHEELRLLRRKLSDERQEQLLPGELRLPVKGEDNQPASHATTCQDAVFVLT